MAQQIETHHPVERCPERSGERHRVFNGQQPLRHIGLQNPDNRLQRHRYPLLTARTRLKSGNSSAKQYSIMILPLPTIFSLTITENESVMASTFDRMFAPLEHLFPMVE
jgi:hypothetical protein